MSQALHATNSQAQPAETRQSNPFAKYDNRIAGVSERILPKQPYLITIPSEYPYRRHTTDPARWYLNTPFHRKEEQLQYMSLLLHQNDDEALLRVDGTRIDEDGRLLAHAPSPRSEVPSRPETPHDAGPKKKISLKDYKTKDRSGINTPERRSADQIRKQAIKSHKEEVEAKKEEPKQQPVVKPGQHALPPKPRAPAVKPEPKSSLATPMQHDTDNQRPVKKRRLSEDDHNPSPKPTIAKHEPIEKKHLPALLSPEMPIPEKKHKRRDLPALLSPKLPQALEKTATTPPQRSDEVRAILKSSIGSPAKLADKKVTNSSKEARVRCDSQPPARPTTPGIKISSPVTKPLAALHRPGTPLATERVASPKPRQMHKIALKYGKKNRKRVEALLKFAPRHKKEASTTHEKEKAPMTKPAIKQETAKTDKKRPAETSPDLPAKKAKLEPPIKAERPSTPKPDLAERLTLQPEKPRSAFSTPKKDKLQSIAMQRVASTDTIDARTPSQEGARASTPLGVNHASQPKASPGPTSAPPAGDEPVTWIDINTRIFQLGRVLKKEGTKLAMESKGKDQQQGVVVLIEALLCFMLNSAALAQARPNADAGWLTILPYYNMVYKQSRQYKHLNGLVVQLGAVTRQHLHNEHIRRLSKETLPDSTDHIGSAPTPGSDGNTRSSSSEDYNKKQKSFLDLRDELVSNHRDLRSAWLESSRLLSTEVIETQYPGTWRKRLKDPSKRPNPERLKPTDLPKEFVCPVDVTCNVFEVTNFALSFLWEWAMIEGVEWKARIDL